MYSFSGFTVLGLGCSGWEKMFAGWGLMFDDMFDDVS